MIRSALIAPAAILLASACAHDDGSGTTIVTSGSTSGVRVTNTRSSYEPAMRLADEICARELACNRIRPGARYRSLEACMADQGATAPTQLSRWECVPTLTQAGFEECLAAIRSERCETALPNADVLEACRSAPVCATNGAAR